MENGHEPATRADLQQLGESTKADLQQLADSEGWRSAFRTDVDHDSEVMSISIPN
jgi:hypothetical protein